MYRRERAWECSPLFLDSSRNRTLGPCQVLRVRLVLALGGTLAEWGLHTVTGRGWGRARRMTLALPPHLGARCALWRKQSWRMTGVSPKKGNSPPGKGNGRCKGPGQENAAHSRNCEKSSLTRSLYVRVET